MRDGDSWAMKRAAVVGAGAMGTLLAAVIGSVMPVVLVCRDAARAANLFRHGARTRGEIERDARPIVVSHVSEIPAAGGASVVFVATKTTAIAQVAADLAPCLDAIRGDTPRLYVVSFQNGIDPGRELMQHLGRPDVMRMVLGVAATLDPRQTHVDVTLNHTPHGLGSVQLSHADDCAAIAAMLTRGGLETVVTTDIESLVWRKAIINAAMNPVAALANCTVGEILDGPSRLIVDRLIEEGLDVAAAAGIEMPDAYLARAMAMADRARDHIPSMVQDIRMGRESEVGQLNRQIIERGRRLGVRTPTHDVIDALIETFDWKVYRRRNETPNGG